MSPRGCIILGSLLAALAVAFGAYGAHGLEEQLTRMLTDGVEPLDETRQALLAKRMGYWEVAARYQMYHAIGIIMAGLVAARQRTGWASLAAGCMLVGILLFSGLLDGMTFGGPKRLGAIVPLGGLAMIVGWLALARAAWVITNPPR